MVAWTESPADLQCSDVSKKSMHVGRSRYQEPGLVYYQPQLPDPGNHLLPPSMPEERTAPIAGGELEEYA